MSTNTIHNFTSILGSKKQELLSFKTWSRLNEKITQLESIYDCTEIDNLLTMFYSHLYNLSETDSYYTALLIYIQNNILSVVYAAYCKTVLYPMSYQSFIKFFLSSKDLFATLKETKNDISDHNSNIDTHPDLFTQFKNLNIPQYIPTYAYSYIPSDFIENVTINQISSDIGNTISISFNIDELTSTKNLLTFISNAGYSDIIFLKKEDVLILTVNGPDFTETQSLPLVMGINKFMLSMNTTSVNIYYTDTSNSFQYISKSLKTNIIINAIKFQDTSISELFVYNRCLSDDLINLFF